MADPYVDEYGMPLESSTEEEPDTSTPEEPEDKPWYEDVADFVYDYAPPLVAARWVGDRVEEAQDAAIEQADKVTDAVVPDEDEPSLGERLQDGLADAGKAVAVGVAGTVALVGAGWLAVKKGWL